MKQLFCGHLWVTWHFSLFDSEAMLLTVDFYKQLQYVLLESDIETMFTPADCICFCKMGFAGSGQFSVLRGYFVLTAIGLAGTWSCVVILVNVFGSILLPWD